MSKTSDASLPEPLRQLRALLADEMQVMDARIAAMVENHIPLIPELSHYTFMAGGKRLRPMLTLACAKLCGYQGEAAVDLAASVEFMHTATLLHDDVVDESDMRRNVATANDIWGNKESILVGDYLLGKAFYLMRSAQSLAVYDVLSKAAVVISEGEVLQLAVTGDVDLPEEVYNEVIASKTAALFAAACEVAGCVSQVSEEKLLALREFGHHLGMAYQVVDDVLDYSARQESLGKDIGNDFAEGKVTLPVIYAIANAEGEERDFWRQIIVAETRNDDDFALALEYMNQSGVLGDAMEEAQRHSDAAKHALNVFEHSEVKTILMSLLKFVVKREY